MALLLSPSASAAGDSAFQTIRWNEDYRHLGAKPQPNAHDHLKYHSLKVADPDGFIAFGGSVRSRINVYDNDRFGLQGGRDGVQWLQRFYGHADVHVDDSLRMFLELTADYADADGDLVPGPFDEDKAALSQAFVDWKIGAIQWRFGRQEMGLGSARLMGTRDGSNVRRSYDGLRLDSHYRDGDWQAFYLRVVDVGDDAFDNTSDGDDAIWGLHTGWPAAHGSVNLYYFGATREDAVYTQGVASETRHSLGIRPLGAFRGWDWDLEAVYQWGDFGDADIRAWTLASIVGYRFAQSWGRPRVALSVNVASGDDDVNDARLTTFNPLYPNLAYFEEAAIYAPQNFYNIEPEIAWDVTPKLGVALDWNFFWRLEQGDAVYVRGLDPLPGTAAVEGHFVAHTPSVSIDYQWNRYGRIDVSYSHFFAREVITRAGGEDVDFVKVQVEWKF